MLVDPKEYAGTLFEDGLDNFEFLEMLDLMRKRDSNDPILLALDAAGDEYLSAVLCELGRLDDAAMEWAIVMREAEANI